MDGWMDGWSDGWMDGWIVSVCKQEIRIDRWMYGLV